MAQPLPSETVRGTLDLLILKTLSLEPMHGWAIAQRLDGSGSGCWSGIRD
jgi:DNA-binding PadR family transcriptional regulator